MEVYRFKNDFEKEDADSLDLIAVELENARNKLNNVQHEKLIECWAKLGERIIRDKEIMNIDGLLFLANWLSYNKLKSFFLDSLGIKNIGDISIRLNETDFMKPYPRGIVCQWVAGNTLTIPIYSIAQAIIVKNSTIVRTSKRNLDFTLKIMKLFSKIETTLPIKEILENIIIVYYPHNDIKSHEILSKIADCKLIWGSEEAISTIKSLAEKETCETVIFGPKYSVVVVDKTSQEDMSLNDILKNVAMDVIIFDQMACSSPQTIFFENSSKSLKEIGEILARNLKKLSVKYPKEKIREDIASKIINKRIEYLLDPDLDLIASKSNDWTIAIGGKVKFEEAVQSRTLFLKNVSSLEEIEMLINQKIQTICLVVKDRNRREFLAGRYNYKGASRCVNQGEMHDYGTPWDGLLILSRLVRWCLLKN